jgi:uncharacterized heparinase superfamily protein
MTRLANLGFRSAGRLHIAAGRFTGIPTPSGVRSLGAPVVGDAQIATDIYNGRWHLAGHTAECSPEGPFTDPADCPAWTEALHGFAWLRDLAASGGELQRVHARGLVMDWMATGCHKLPPARRTTVTAERVTAWTVHAPFLLVGAPAAFEAAFLDELGRQVRVLLLVGPASDDAAERLAAAAAVALAAVALRGLEGMQPQAFEQLMQELQRQILPDGGHETRSPQRLAECLLAIMPAVRAAEGLRVGLPAALGSCVMRMTTALRFFLHRDGGLAVFNGVALTLAGEIGEMLAAMPATSALPHRLPQSGYIRFSQANTVLLVDGGHAPPGCANPLAVPAPGAFELSDGADRLVVNCGAPVKAHRDWVKAARTTAACSAAVIGDASAGRRTRSALVARILGAPPITGLYRCETEIDETTLGLLIKIGHDGYAARFGCWHERRIFLSANGHDLRGEDSFHLGEGADALPDFAIRFHLHPSVSVEIGAEGVRLETPGGRTWAFIARGGRLAVEPSVYLPDQPIPAASRQIVLRGSLAEVQRVTWSFKRNTAVPH